MSLQRRSGTFRRIRFLGSVAHRWFGVALLCGLLALGGCTGGTAPASSSAAVSEEPSIAASEPETPSAAASSSAPSASAAASVCLEPDVLAAIEAYKDGDVPEHPSMDEVADALAALELDGNASDYRDGVVEALRGETGETLDTMKIHDAMFSLIPLQSEIALDEC